MSISFGGAPVFAAENTLSVSLDSIFEIQAVVPMQASVSWVLSENNQYRDSGKEAVFTKKFTQTGTYSLVAQIVDGVQKRQETFILNVHNDSIGTMPTVQEEDIVRFLPMQKGSIVPIDNTNPIITIYPAIDDIKMIAIDFNTKVDTNGDGNPQNDDDTKYTLFRSGKHPLYVWIPDVPSTIRIGALRSNNTTLFKEYDIQRVETVSNVVEPSINKDSTISILKNDNGTVQFSLPSALNNDTPLLLYWNFGDGQSSMLDLPIHEYAKSGEYSVSVQIRDLKTGKTIQTVNDSITINRLQELPETVPTKQTEKKSSGILGTLVKILFILIISSALAAGIFFVIGMIKKRGFSLEKTIEKAEKTMVKTPEEVVQEGMAPPMEIEAEPVIETETAEEQIITSPVVKPATPEPSIPSEPDEAATESTAPAWLQASPSPVPELVKSTEEVSALQSREEIPPQTEIDNAPDWLQAGLQHAETHTNTPADSPAETVTSPKAPTTTETEEEIREREKKRNKRQRYRENLKKRKSEATDQKTPETTSESQVTDDPNEPVAFITAEDIKPLEEKEDS